MDKAPDAFRTISEVADDLDIPQHVLRFWETRFSQIKPMKRSGGRRYYRPDDVALLRGIRRLLYGEGYTIRGVQRILREQGIKAVQALAEPEAPSPSAVARAKTPAPRHEPAVFAGEEAIEAEEFDATEEAEDAAPESDEAAADEEEEGDGDEGEDEGEDEDEDAEDEEEEAEPAPVHRPAGVAPPVVVPPSPRPQPQFQSRQEPLAAAPIRPPGPLRAQEGLAASPIPPPRAPRADLARLRGALDDLLACKRLVDEAIKASPPELFPLKDR